jgi:hypothetical protein
VKGYDLHNTSTWLVTYDLTNTSVWNASANSQDIDKAYWFRQLASYGTPYEETYPFCPPTGDASTVMSGGMWNDFSGDTPGRFPNRFSEWPINFTATWVYGTARSDFLTINNVGENMPNFDENIFPVSSTVRIGCESLLIVRSFFQTTGCDPNNEVRFNLSMWTEIPIMQSLSCRPVIEKADTSVTVGVDGRVRNFELMSETKAIDQPWQDVFVAYSHNSSDGDNTLPTTNNDQERNATSRYVADDVNFITSHVNLELVMVFFSYHLFSRLRRLAIRTRITTRNGVSICSTLMQMEVKRPVECRLPPTSFMTVINNSVRI